MASTTSKVRVRIGAAAVAVLCGAALTAIAAPGSAASAAGTRDTVGVRVIEQNINYSLNAKTLPNLEAQFRAENPDVVMIVEICRSGVQQFESAFPSWHAHYTPNRKVQSGCAKASGGVSYPYSKGELLASPHSITNVTRYGLADSPHDPSRQFHLTCGDVMLGAAGTQGLRACATHLRNGRNAPWKYAERTKQASQIAKILKPRIDGGQPVVLSGDFNAKPFEAPLDSLYGLDAKGQYTSSGGQFDESQQSDKDYWKDDPSCTSHYHCRSGQPTIREPNQPVNPQGRYDDIFYSRANTSDLHGYRLPYNGSDHYPISSTAKVSLATS
ncbi:MAG: endonuclease/exonuclease/phosphatase family protein [Jatrophihabitans endophyticus]|nr:endonuclease/exonuclease/phosphatase family protein [Jatrophihabitans endophyticus]